MCMNVAYMYVHSPTCMFCTHRGQKRSSNPWELKLETTVSHCVGAGNQTEPTEKASVLATEQSH